MRSLLRTPWRSRSGSALSDSAWVIGLFGLAGVIWYLHMGGGEGLSDTLVYVFDRLRELASIGR